MPDRHPAGLLVPPDVGKAKMGTSALGGSFENWQAKTVETGFQGHILITLHHLGHMCVFGLGKFETKP